MPLISLLKIFSLFLSCSETVMWHFNIITFAVTQRHCVVFSPQAFASERVFGVLSETLYNLLQLVGGPRSRLSSFSKVLSQQFGILFPTIISFRTGSRDRKRITS